MADVTSVSDLKGVAIDILCDRYSEVGWERAPVHAPVEQEITIYVNRQELVTILCTPSKLNFLVLGFLYAEGIISGLQDVAMMRVCDEESEVDVLLANPEYQLPTQKRTLTSGCGGGATFKVQAEKVESTFVVSPEDVLSLMKQLLQEQMHLYQLSGGVHASALADAKNLLIVAEDIGRHNTVDKIQGECLLRGISTKDRLLLSTGRVSSEMLLKAARMQVPVVVSRHSPTGSAVTLARDLGIALVASARGGRMLVCSHPERLGRAAG